MKTAEKNSGEPNEVRQPAWFWPYSPARVSDAKQLRAYVPLNVLIFGLLIFGPLTSNLPALLTWEDDVIITGDLDVGTSGTNKDLHVTGTATVGGKIGVGLTSPGAQAHVESGTSTDKGLIVQGAASQTANLQEWQDSNGRVLANIKLGLSGQGVFAVSGGTNASANIYTDSNLSRLVLNGGGGASQVYGAGIELPGAGSNRMLYIGTGVNSGSNSRIGLHVWDGASSQVEVMTIRNTTGYVGIGTINPTATLDVDGDVKISGDITVSGTMNVTGPVAGSNINGLVFGGISGTGTIPVEGAGTRMMWYPGKAAFRAGIVEGTEWDDANVGSYSTAFGYNSKASGDYSTAMGSYSSASGYGSTAMGNSVASGAFSTAIGNSVASGSFSTAIGEWTAADSYVSLAIGKYNVGGGDQYGWVNEDPLFEIGNGNPHPLFGGSRRNALTVLKNGKTTITHIAHEALQPMAGDFDTANQNERVALKIEGHADFKGKIRMPRQGDILMGEFGNP